MFLYLFFFSPEGPGGGVDWTTARRRWLDPWNIFFHTFTRRRLRFLFLFVAFSPEELGCGDGCAAGIFSSTLSSGALCFLSLFFAFTLEGPGSGEGFITEILFSMVSIFFVENGGGRFLL